MFGGEVHDSVILWSLTGVRMEVDDMEITRRPGKRKLRLWEGWEEELGEEIKRVRLHGSPGELRLRHASAYALGTVETSYERLCATGLIRVVVSRVCTGPP